MLFFLSCYFVLGSINANNISVQKVAITDTNRAAKTAVILFNISWEHSWRDDVNWDAAWIFIKFRLPKDSIWQYKHLTMSASNNNPGTGNTVMKFAVPDDKKGIFYYRQSNGGGNIKMDSVKLFWDYGADNVENIDSVEVKVFATEMVYVPEGTYCLGDGNGKERTSNSFQIKNAPNNFVTITNNWSPLINTFQCITCGGNDDAILTNTGVRISGLNGIDITGDKLAEYPDFPTGYRSFYVMKYPVTQGQYADFLNTLSLRDSSQTQNWIDTTKLKRIHPKFKIALQNLDPFFYSIPIDVQRHTILLDTTEVKYTVSRPDRAFGKGTSTLYESFSDWSAMRPMTELEYEKAARGPLPPAFKIYNSAYTGKNDTSTNWHGGDWAWGNDTMIARVNPWDNNIKLNYSGIENGTEVFTNYTIYNRYSNPAQNQGAIGAGGTTGGDGGNGPYRVGIFANDTSSRISSGATYYGIMDFSKNVSQITVSLGTRISRTFSYKKNGDGLLNTYGNSDSGEFFTTDNNMGPAMTGGSYIIKQNEVSGRNTYSNYMGFRSVRSAPSDN